jgi:peptide/nickel transport system permease protein
MMGLPQPVLLWSDALLFMLIAAVVALAWWARQQEPLRAAWAEVGRSPVAMASATILAVFLLIGLLDSLHYRARLADSPATSAAPQYSVEVSSALDALLTKLRTRSEKTYSAPLATHLYAKETAENSPQRDFPRLKYGGAHLGEQLARQDADIAVRTLRGVAAGVLCWLLLHGLMRLIGRPTPAMSLTLLLIAMLGGIAVSLSAGYHVFGTDKVGQDVLYLSLKSVRTALLIGTLTTLVMLPVAVLLGILAGYAGGWIDDAIQYIYTTLNSIPGVLLIAAAVLMMQVVIDTHPDWFATAAERADARLLALCLILGMTSWTGVARLLRGETLKLRELEFVQAARAFGVSDWAIMRRHILPNLMHIVLIALVMDFSGLVLAEAVLSYVGVGVDPSTTSFGTMINAARMELAREPMVWWSLVAAFGFMFTLVLAANLFADVVRDAFDPRRAR